MNFFSTFKSLPYENRVYLLVTSLTIFRIAVGIIIALVQPHAEASLSIVSWAVLLILIFIFFLILSRGKDAVISIHPIFAFILTLLTAYQFVQFNGIYSFTRFNYYCLIFATCIIYRGRWLNILLSFQMMLLTVLTYASAYKLEWFMSLSVGVKLDPLDFFFDCALIAILSFNLKTSTSAEINRVNGFNAQLAHKVDQTNQTNELLIAKSKELLEAQQHMEDEIKRRTDTLSKQQKAIEIYVQMNTRVIHDPIEALGTVINKLPKDHTLSIMMMSSQMELQEVLNTIRHTLDSEKELNRNKIRIV